MRPEVIVRHLGYILLFNGIFLFISFLISLFGGESSAIPLLFSATTCFILGLFPMIFVPVSEDLSFNEGVIIVVAGWTITCLIGTLPYVMWGGEFSFTNAWFESVSGYTTTGSTILNDIESLPKGLLFWRSSTHFIGGIGIILFALLILPQSKSSRIVLLHAEMSEISKSNFRTNARKVIFILVLVYFGLAFSETILLMFAGLNFFDAINHSFATVATGGFSTKNLSVASFNSISVEVIIMGFMVLSGIHFGLLFNTFTGKSQNIFKSSVTRTYILVMTLGIIAVALKLFTSGTFNSGDSLRYASFQVISLASTTGFANADSATWPFFTQIILMYFTIQCAMVGSTSGGMKFDRVFLFFKSIKKLITEQNHPNAVVVIKVDKNPISEQLINHTAVFIILYIFIFFVTTVLLTLVNVDVLTAFSASIATIGNVGPGFGDVSSLGNFSGLPDIAKWLLSVNMLMGRLEIFNILALFYLKN